MNVNKLRKYNLIFEGTPVIKARLYDKKWGIDSNHRGQILKTLVTEQTSFLRSLCLRKQVAGIQQVIVVRLYRDKMFFGKRQSVFHHEDKA